MIPDCRTHQLLSFHFLNIYYNHPIVTTSFKHGTTKWAAKGECETNGVFMLNFCIKSCQICGYTGNLTELIHLKKQLALVGGDETLLQTPYGMTQHVNSGDEHEDAVNQVLANMTEYMEGIIFVDPAFENVKLTCKNRHVNCAFWVAIGECEAVRAYQLS